MFIELNVWIPSSNLCTDTKIQNAALFKRTEFACNETNLMHYLSPVYSVTAPLHVSQPGQLTVK
jgi:hypothetical protein